MARRVDLADVLGVIVSVVLVNLVGASPAVFVGSDTAWIDRPWFYPPEVLFPIVWTLLFTLLGVALYLVWKRGRGTRAGNVALGVFVLQFGLNLAWTPVFFGLREPGLALGVIVLLWIAIVATIIAFDRVDRRAALLIVPYLLWVSFATVLNAAIAIGA